MYPDQMTSENLKEMNTTCARSFVNKDMSALALYALETGAASDLADAWVYACHDVYMAPVGVSRGTLFSYSQENVDNIKRRNPSLETVEFLLPKDASRPFPVIGATLVGPTAGAPYFNNR